MDQFMLQMCQNTHIEWGYDIPELLLTKWLALENDGVSKIKSFQCYEVLWSDEKDKERNLYMETWKTRIR